MEIQKKNIIAAYEGADESQKTLLRKLFPDLFTAGCIPAEQCNRPVTERIKTFEDAKNELGNEHQLVKEYWAAVNTEVDLSYDLVAYLKLRIICAALNEGWEPKFTEDEVRWYPWHWLYTQQEIYNMRNEERKKRAMMSTDDYVTEYAGFASAHSNNAPSTADANIGSRLCLKSIELASYCGTQFIKSWADFKLLRK